MLLEIHLSYQPCLHPTRRRGDAPGSCPASVPDKQAHVALLRALPGPSLVSTFSEAQSQASLVEDKPQTSGEIMSPQQLYGGLGARVSQEAGASHSSPSPRPRWQSCPGPVTPEEVGTCFESSPGPWVSWAMGPSQLPGGSRVGMGAGQDQGMSAVVTPPKPWAWREGVRGFSRVRWTCPQASVCQAALGGLWGSEMSGQGAIWDRLRSTALGTGSPSCSWVPRASVTVMAGCLEKLSSVWMGGGLSAPGFAFGLQGEGQWAWPGQIGAPPQQEAWVTSPAGEWPPAGLPPGFATTP